MRWRLCPVPRMAAWLSVFLAVGLMPRGAAAAEDARIAEVQRLTDQAMQLRREAKLTEAIAVWKRRLALVREIMGSDSNEAVAGSQEILAQLQEANNDFAAAARARRRPGPSAPSCSARATGR